MPLTVGRRPRRRETTAYAWTRFFGSFPLPAFLVLAGAAIALRVDAAVMRHEDATAVRTRIVTRGLQVVVYGYATNFAYALLDGWDSLATLLRADVLHCIGLSIAVTAALGVRATKATAVPSRRRLAIAAALVGILSTLSCPWITRATKTLHANGLGFVVGLFADVPTVTDMPVIPLIAWLCAGVLSAQAMLRARQRAQPSSTGGGIPRSFTLGLGSAGAFVAAVASHATTLVLDRLEEPLSRENPGVWFNVLDLAGRGCRRLGLRHRGGWLGFGVVALGLAAARPRVTGRLRLPHSVLLRDPRRTDERQADDDRSGRGSRPPLCAQLGGRVGPRLDSPPLREIAMKTGLVMSGGGARGAYEAGLVAGLVEVLGLRPSDPAPFHIYAGTSVGAINAAYLAAHADRGDLAIDGLIDAWTGLSLRRHLKVDTLRFLGLRDRLPFARESGCSAALCSIPSPSTRSCETTFRGIGCTATFSTV